jgi:hypothetical protein
VATHGSESYYVIGEGLLDESVGGRERTLAAAVERATPPFRFRRIGPRGRALGEENRRRIANAMTAGGGGKSDIPAGYTYLGQFVDHDLTFDKTNVTFGETVSPSQLLQARSPSLDLDSLYGAGPQDPDSAKFYKDDRHLKMGKTVALDPDPAFEGHDLPRGAGSTKKQKQKAVIPDPRNDENLAVAQTHLAMIRFHNRIVDTLPASVPAPQRFAKARELAVKHYQWMLRHDYLPRICKPSVVDEVFSDGRKVVEVNATPTDVPAMPIEFSVATFRLGHAMIRPDYNWNRRFPGEQGALFFLFDFSGTSGTLAGLPRLPSNWIADFRRLYDFKGEAGKTNLAPPGGLNFAMRIDTLLTNPLKFLPKGSFGGIAADEGTAKANLAFRNLVRAKMVKLASGQQMAAHLRGKGVPVTTLTKAQIRNGNGGAKLDKLTPAQRDGLATNTPLWFYVLREAELNDGQMRGVGGRLVAETFHRAMEGSQHSIVRDTAFRPTFGPDANTFRMVDLLLFAFEGKKKLLAPLG